jgi:hypothetical protein
VSGEAADRWAGLGFAIGRNDRNFDGDQPPAKEAEECDGSFVGPL